VNELVNSYIKLIYELFNSNEEKHKMKKIIPEEIISRCKDCKYVGSRITGFFKVVHVCTITGTEPWKGFMNDMDSPRRIIEKYPEIPSWCRLKDSNDKLNNIFKDDTSRRYKTRKEAYTVRIRGDEVYYDPNDDSYYIVHPKRHKLFCGLVILAGIIILF